MILVSKPVSAYILGYICTAHNDTSESFTYRRYEYYTIQH